MGNVEKLMRMPLIVTFAAIALWGVALAQEPSSKPAESQPATVEGTIDAIEAEMKAARDAWFKDYRAAKTDEEKEQLFKEKYPKPETWFPRLYVIAKAAPRSKDAEMALMWIATRGRGADASVEAVEVLLRDHIESDGLAELPSALGSSGSPKTEELLKALETRSPHKTVKGRALYARAERRKGLLEGDAHVEGVGPAANQKELESLLEQVAEKYADVEAYEGVTLGDRARGDLFETRFLAIGKVAPEITGKDADGKDLKLSDFKGKVVVLDFWGNW